MIYTLLNEIKCQKFFTAYVYKVKLRISPNKLKGSSKMSGENDFDILDDLLPMILFGIIDPRLLTGKAIVEKDRDQKENEKDKDDC